MAIVIRQSQNRVIGIITRYIRTRKMNLQSEYPNHRGDLNDNIYSTQVSAIGSMLLS